MMRAQDTTAGRLVAHRVASVNLHPRRPNLGHLGRIRETTDLRVRRSL